MFALAFSLTACGDEPDESEEEEDEEEIAVEEEEEEGFDFTGVWALTMSEGGGTIVNTVFVYPDGIAETVSGVVTIPEGITMGVGPSGQNKGSYEVSGEQITMHALNGSSTLNGMFTSHDSASGTITSQAGTYSWTAVKTSDLPPEYEIVGTWMINLHGYGPGEVSRFQQIYLNSDGTADIDWQKVQMDDGQIHEGELLDYYDSYTYDGETVVITADGGNFVLTGEYVENGDSGVPELQGTWVNTVTGDTGTFEGVYMN